MNLKKKILSLSIFLATSGYSLAQAPDSSPVDSFSIQSVSQTTDSIPADTLITHHANIVAGPALLDTSKPTVPMPLTEVKQLPDTIWDYAYPVLEEPWVVLNDDGTIMTFRCSGLYFNKSSNKRSRGLNRSNSEYLYVDDQYEELWRIGMDDIKRRLGIKNEEVQLDLVIQTIAYHKKQKDVAEREKAAVLDWRKRPYKEMRYVENFVDMMNHRRWGLNSRGRLTHEMYLRNNRYKSK
ncbi:MAG: hypothetical protein LBF37_02135 [Rickettsiales bacterium]|nr:hypothetical protein [Rickettsiales bacterium]